MRLRAPPSLSCCPSGAGPSSLEVAQQARKQRRIERRQQAWEEARDRAVEEAKEEEARRVQALMDQGMGKRKAREKVKRVSPQVPPAPSFEDILTTSSDEDLPMCGARAPGPGVARPVSAVPTPAICHCERAQVLYGHAAAL